MRRSIGIVAAGCIILFQNNFGSEYKPPIWIKPKPYVDPYIYEPEVEMPVVVEAWHFPAPKVEHPYVAAHRPYAENGKVPATIALAQGILESDYGNSDLAVKANNHFGIKCFSRSCKPGHCINKTDDSHKDFFVRFGSAEDSYKAHDEFLQRPRYKRLFDIPCTDEPIQMVYNPYLKGRTVIWNGQPMKAGATYTLPGKAWWCIHLCASGYATDKRYADKLYKIIREHDL